MSKTGLAVIIYGALLIVMGLLGYRSGSHVSGYLGVGFGALLLGCSALMHKGNKHGLHAALAISLILTAVFSVRYSVTGKELTAGLAVLSAAMLLLLLAKTVRWKS